MKKYIFSVLASATLLSCTHKEVRTPAGASSPFTEDGAAAVNEIFGSDSPTGKFRHKLYVDFYTNGDRKYLSETAKKAIGEALEKTLTENTDQSLVSAALGNIKGAMIDNFVKTLRLYKITNTGLQLDLTVIPEKNSKDSFADELNSNQLVRLDQVGGVSSQWSQLETATYLDSIYKNSSLVGTKSKKADFIGGVVSLYAEILDATPGFGRPLQNAVKGFVRYRRYYRVNQNLGSFTCDKYTVTAQSRGGGVPQFYTVDLYKNFNLKNLIPVEETVEISPGYIVASGEGRRELSAFGDKDIGKTIRTTNYSVQDKSISSVGSFYIKKISYNLSNKEIDIAGSEMGPIDIKGDMNSGLSRARQAFLKKCEPQMKKFLKLSEVVPGDLL